MKLPATEESQSLQRRELFISLYKYAFPDFARFVNKMNGTLDEAKDVFQDAIIIWYEKAVSSGLQITNSEKAYILGTARHLWLKRYRALAKEVSLNADINLDTSEDDNAKPSELKVLHFLEAAGKKCMELLRAFYYDKTSPEELAQQFGFAGSRSATVQKFKCLEKVRNQVKLKSLSYADFID